MKLIKYSKGITSNSSTGTRGGGTSSTVSSVELDRNIWGLHDEGGDIDGSMVVNGNVNILAIIPPNYDADEDDDGEDIDVETGGGNLNVELKITSKELEANDIYAKEHLYIPHPTTKVKTDIVELLKGYDTRITNNSTNIANNKTEINNLKNRVTTVEGKVTNLTTTVNNHTTAINNNITNILNNADEIEKLKNQVSNITGDIEGIDLTEITNTLKSLLYELKVARYGSYQHPIILLSGKIRKYSYTNATGSYHFDGCKSELITDLNISVDGGTLSIIPTFAENSSYNICSIHVTLEMSGDTANNDSVTKSSHSPNTSIGGRSDGAHWFEAYLDGTTIKVREFHQKNGDNDSWGTDNWAGDGGGIRAINITVIGYLFLYN